MRMLFDFSKDGWSYRCFDLGEDAAPYRFLAAAFLGLMPPEGLPHYQKGDTVRLCKAPSPAEAMDGAKFPTE